MSQPSPSSASILHFRPKDLPFALLTILGLTFWFVLGFPFANSNESYLWIAQLKQLTFIDTLTKNIAPVASLRPLGIATAWLGYRLSGGSIYPQQLFNFAGAILAWLILFVAMPEKKLFGWVSLLVGGAFFSGYIYLFHLHGVFYSPLLIYLAVLLAVSLHPDGLQVRKLAILAVLAIVAALYHPYALPFFVAFILGYSLENLRALTRQQIWVVATLLVAALILIKLLVPGQPLQFTAEVAQGFLTSFKSVEVNLALSLVSWLLAVVTVLSLELSRPAKAILLGVISVALPVFIHFHLPFLFVWLIVSLAKTVILRKWSFTLLILVSVLLPAVTATGSPTYVLPVLMACGVVTPLDWPYLEKDSTWQNLAAVVLSVLVMAVAVPLRAGLHLPLISGLVSPVLAEKEKTFQLESIISWRMASPYSQSPLELCERADNPVESTNALDRTHRPPTSQDYLDAYLSSVGEAQPPGDSHPLLVCFGGETVANAARVYVLPGRYAGDAIVFKCDASDPAACTAQPQP